MSMTVNTNHLQYKQCIVLVPREYDKDGDHATKYFISFIGSKTAAKKHQSNVGWQFSIIAEVNAVYGADGKLRAKKK